jgi:hypothetical protein
MMRRLTLGLRHSPIYYITFVIPALQSRRGRADAADGHGTARRRLAGRAGGSGSISAQANADPGRPASHSAQRKNAERGRAAPGAAPARPRSASSLPEL